MSYGRAGGDHPPHRDRRRAGAAPRRGGSGRRADRAPAPRLPGVLVLVAPPAHGVGRRRDSTSSRPTSAATPARAPRRRWRTTRCCTSSATRSACWTRWVRSRPWSSGTTGARRSPGTRRCCDPTGCRASSRCRCRCCRAARARRPPRWRAASAPTSTSSTSSAPGVADRELAADPRATFRRLLTATAAPAPAPRSRYPRVAACSTPAPSRTRLPEWLTEADLDVYVAEYAVRGFTGGLNWYRNHDRTWALTAAWRDAQVSGARGLRSRASATW